MNRKIIWLASYPKSGNTWFRIFLKSYLQGGTPVDINQLEFGFIASERESLEDVLGFHCDQLTHDEVDHFRPDVYRYLAEFEHLTYRKVHDAFGTLPDGRFLFPSDCSKAAIYLVRNPLDVAVSYAHHQGHQNYDRVIQKMADPNYAMSDKKDRWNPQLRQRLGSWDQHVSSWLDQDQIPVHLMTYEAMKVNPKETFSKALTFLGLELDAKTLENALLNSDFPKLAEQESQYGFREKAPKANVFFRAGQVGSWQSILSQEQVDQVLSQHHKTMARLGYLDGCCRDAYLDYCRRKQKNEPAES